MKKLYLSVTIAFAASLYQSANAALSTLGIISAGITSIINKKTGTQYHQSRETFFLGNSIHRIDAQHREQPILYLSPEEKTACPNPNALKELFQKNKITVENKWDLDEVPEPVTNEIWETLYKQCMEERKQLKIPYLPKFLVIEPYLSLEQAIKLPEDAQLLLESFLPVQNPNFQELETNYIEKSNLERLFTYAELEATIKKKKLSHIHLPKKILIVKNKKTEEYVDNDIVSELLKNSLKITVISRPPLNNIPSDSWYRLPRIQLQLPQFPKEYSVHIYAEKQHRTNTPLNDDAVKELVELIRETPFDVGYDNIFTDNNGDAIIIDTEFKSDPAFSSITKLLARYPMSKKIAEEIKTIYFSKSVDL